MHTTPCIKRSPASAARRICPAQLHRDGACSADCTWLSLQVCLKGTLFTPLSKHNTSTQSLNVQLRKQLDLHVNIVHGFSVPGMPTRHDNVNIVVIRSAPTACMVAVVPTGHITVVQQRWRKKFEQACSTAARLLGMLASVRSMLAQGKHRG